jgi:hypothetical protein
MSAAGVASRRNAKNNYSGRAYVAEQEPRYKALWRAFGWDWRNRYFAAAHAVNTIPGRDHGELNPNFHYTDDQRDEAMVQLADMGWFKGLPIRPGVYDTLLIMGAKYGAMVNRTIMLRARLNKTKPSEVVRFKRIYALSGQRPREDVDRNGRTIDGTVEEIYASLSDAVRNHPWVEAQMSLMDRANAYEEFGGAFATEFELMVLSFLVAYNGNVDIHSHVRVNDAVTLDGVPLRKVESCTITLPGADGEDAFEVIVINAPAVERPYGDPRPTSISTTKHLIEHYGLSGGTVVVVTVRVHGRRMLGDSERTIHSIDPSINVIGYADSIEGDVLEYFPHALAEAVNQLVKAVEEELNDLRPAGSRRLDLKQVREYLDRLYQSPTMETLLAIQNEVATA